MTSRRDVRRASDVASGAACHPRTYYICAPPEDGKMAVQVTHASSYYGSEDKTEVDATASMSDYGSEFDATEVNEDTLLASTLDSITQRLPGPTEKSSVLPSIEFEEGELEDQEQDALVAVHKPSLLRVARTGAAKRGRHSTGDIEARRDAQSSPVRQTMEVEYDERSRRVWSGALITLSDRRSID